MMKLKKILLASAIVASLAGIMATGAFAEEAKMTATWDADSKSVIIENCPTTAARKTLLVLTTNTDGSQLENVAEENIKQIDEQADAYTKVFVGDLDDGKYEVRVGGDGSLANAFFTVGKSGSDYYDNGTRILGDANNSGDLTSGDASDTLVYVANGGSRTKDALQAMDMNDSGDITSGDASAILTAITGGSAIKTIADKKNFVPVN